VESVFCGWPETTGLQLYFRPEVRALLAAVVGASVFVVVVFVVVIVVVVVVVAVGGLASAFPVATLSSKTPSMASGKQI